MEFECAAAAGAEPVSEVVRFPRMWGQPFYCGQRMIRCQVGIPNRHSDHLVASLYCPLIQDREKRGRAHQCQSIRVNRGLSPTQK
jgi:hypothetical protein